MTSERTVGPVVVSGEIGTAVTEAIRRDNPGKEVVIEDRGSYLRIGVDDECIIRQATLEEELGHPFPIRDLEVNMPSFVGQIDTGSDSIRFYLKGS